MSEIQTDTSAIACCGLYCPACGKFRKGKCPGCARNDKASWCKVRTCCMEKQIASCADCDEFADPAECKKFDNFMSRVFGLFFNSNRGACVAMIKDKGYDGYAAHMADLGKMSLPR